MTIDLSDSDFQSLMFILANAEGKGITWNMVNPLLMKIGNQLRQQHEAAQMAQMRPTNSKSPEDHRDESTH